jgi:hypothetical protein
MREFPVLQYDLNAHKEILVLIATLSAPLDPASEQPIFDRTGLKEGFVARLALQYRQWGERKILKVFMKK